MTITVGIKALNEEAHIAESVESALAAVAPFGGRVVLADSGSRDRTIAIASQYPIHIVQLANPAERSCGTGAQLAFQHCEGDYFYLLDGDMVLDPDYLAAGVAYLEANPKAAGVGGMVIQRNVESAEFQIRADARQADKSFRSGSVDRLDCGGLYRVAAIQSVGYFADRNLHAFEEFELGARLRSNGWTLARIDQPAVSHYGHQTGGYRLLWRRLRSGYSGSVGEVLRAAAGASHLSLVLRDLSHIRHSVAVILWWLAIVAGLFVQPYISIALLILPILFLWMRRGSLTLGLYSLTSWNVNAIGLITGFFRRRRPPVAPLASVIVK